MSTQAIPLPSLSRGRGLAVLAFGCAAALVPWTLYLAGTLPAVHVTTTWTGTWVGFDVALLAVLALTGLAALRRHRLLAPLALVGATLLGADAWFDVMTSTGVERTGSIACAALVELPLAVLLARAALRALPAEERAVSVARPAGSA